MPQTQLHGRLRRRRGSVLLDAMIGLKILAMGAASFYSVFPVVTKAHKIGESQQKATQIATKMLEHIQLLSPTKLDASTLSSMQLIDAGQSSSPYTFTHLPLDDSTDYSPATALKNGKGTLTINDLQWGSKQVVVTITWKSASGKDQSTTMGTILGAYRP